MQPNSGTLELPRLRTTMKDGDGSRDKTTQTTETNTTDSEESSLTTESLSEAHRD